MQTSSILIESVYRMPVNLDEIAANKKPLQNRKQLKVILTTIYDKTGKILRGYDYRIVGTAASLLQGVNISTNGIDILFRDRRGIDEIHKILSKIKCFREPEFLGI